LGLNTAGGGEAAGEGLVTGGGTTGGAGVTGTIGGVGGGTGAHRAVAAMPTEVGMEDLDAWRCRCDI